MAQTIQAPEAATSGADVDIYGELGLTTLQHEAAAAGLHEGREP